MKVRLDESQYKRLLVNLNEQEVIEEGWKEAVIGALMALTPGLTMSQAVNKVNDLNPQQQKSIVAKAKHTGNFELERNVDRGIRVVSDSVISTMNELFSPNMITPDKQSIENFLKKAKDSLESKIGHKLDNADIYVGIESSASADPATNILPRGVDKPDHTYDGNVPEEDWVKPGEEGGMNVAGGNAWLSQERANKTQELLGQMGIDSTIIDVKVSDKPGAEHQYVRLTVKIKTTKEVKPVDRYNWGDINIHRHKAPDYVPATKGLSISWDGGKHHGDFSTWLQYMQHIGIIKSLDKNDKSKLLEIIIGIPRGEEMGGEKLHQEINKKGLSHIFVNPNK